MSENLFSFGQHTKSIASIGFFFIITIISILIITHVFKSKHYPIVKVVSTTAEPTVEPTVQPVIPGSDFSTSKLTTLTNWTNTYKNIDTKNFINSISKFLQLRSGQIIVISKNPGFLGNLFLMDDFTGKNNTNINKGQDALVDINEYTDTVNKLFYLATGVNGSGYLYADISKFTIANTNGGNMIQLLYSQIQNDGVTYSCISGGSYWVSNGEIKSQGYTAIDGPEIGNKNSYVKMIELKDGRVLLATLNDKLFVSPTMKNKDYTQIKEIPAPPSLYKYVVSSFTQLKDDTVVVIYNSGDVFIKKAGDLVNKDISWTRVKSIDSIPTISVQIAELSDGTILSVGSDGYLYFLS